MACAALVSSRWWWNEAARRVQHATTMRTEDERNLPGPCVGWVRAGRCSSSSGRVAPGAAGVEDPRRARRRAFARWRVLAGFCGPQARSTSGDALTYGSTHQHRPVSALYFCPGLRGAQEACQRRNDRGKPVRALRRPPLALEQPGGLLARGRGRPRSDGAIPCLVRRVSA